MAEYDNDGYGYLIRGKKELEPVQVPVYALDPKTGMAYEAATYPLDKAVTKIYHSRAGGFVPPSAGADTCFSQLHYGEGFFEGMRFYYSPYGVVMPRPWMNYARFLHSATVFNPKLAKVVADHFGQESSLERMHMGIPLTPRNYYDLAEQCYREGRAMAYPLILEHKDGRTEELQVAMAMQVAGRGGIVTDLTMRKMDTIIKVLAYTGGLVSADYFPEGLEMMLAGYIRPWGWVSGEAGLKVPSITVSSKGGIRTIGNKPLYFAAATLPWAFYLTEKDYASGLDVLVSPYQRIMDDTMPSNAKVAANYVNSAMAINMGMMFGFGEILAFNRDGRFVEGSAENAFVMMEEGGKIVAYTPPISGGCLPGTTRDGVIRAIDRLGVEVRYQALELRHLYDAKAIILTGTGAQMIHVRSITELEAAKKIADAVRLRSEGMEYLQSVIGREDFKRQERLVNGGERHGIVDLVQGEYRRMLVDDASLLEPVHNLDFSALAELLRIEPPDFIGKADRKSISAGMLSEKINGIAQPDDLAQRNRMAARLIRNAFKKAKDPGIPVRKLMRGY